jgi:hypothetical protein
VEIFGQMKSLIKKAGFILILIGVFFLITSYVTHLETNASLLTGWILITAGIIVYTVIKKYLN